MAAGKGLSAKARAELVRPNLPIAGATQFPPFVIRDDPGNAKVGLAAGLGVVVFDGPRGRVFFKGGHNDITDNQMICVDRAARCILILTNSGVGARAFPALTEAALGDIGMPWRWEYGPAQPAAAP